MQNLKEIEEKVKEILRGLYSASTFSLWLADLTLAEMDETTAVFSIYSNFKCGWIQQQYYEPLSNAVEEVTGSRKTLRFVSTEPARPARLYPPFKSEVFPEEEEEEEEEGPSFGEQIESHSIVDEYTFDNFIVGSSNRFAHAAALAVAKFGNSYNPLFIYGNSGLGKTHLLYAVTNEMKRNRPNIRIMYRKCEEFVNEFIASMQNNSMDRFRDRYRHADALLIDDIQFIAGKESTQEEFFNTFTALYEDGRKIILTSDRPPKEIEHLSDRLRTRFEWGLIADIQPPDSELRTAIIMQKAKNLNVPVTPEIVSFLSDKLLNNIRQIEGAIRKIGAVSSMLNIPITLDMVRRSIADRISEDDCTHRTVDRIFTEVSRFFGIDEEDIKQGKRTKQIAEARHICVYLIRTQTSLSTSAIGQIFGGKDHTTIINSTNRVEEKMRQDIDYRDMVEGFICNVKV